MFTNTVLEVNNDLNLHIEQSVDALVQEFGYTKTASLLQATAESAYGSEVLAEIKAAYALEYLRNDYISTKGLGTHFDLECVTDALGELYKKTMVR